MSPRFTSRRRSSGCLNNCPAMTRLRDWPALAGLSADSGVLRYHRAARGKVHRAPTDYRWIAATAGFDPQSSGLLESSSLGGEDELSVVFAWRPAAGGFAAMRAYPSRARDAAGRPGG